MPVEKSVLNSASSDTVIDLLYPLNEFYVDMGFPLPEVTQVQPSDIPEPYHHLLVHERDMTPTLEAACGQSLHLRVLNYSLDEDIFSRHVVLVPDYGGPAVEMGAIKIYLEYFSAEARRLILERRQPLGSILQTQHIPHESHPSAFIRVVCDDVIREGLRLSSGGILYGRQNVLTGAEGRVLARVLEILPPWDIILKWEKDRG